MKKRFILVLALLLAIVMTFGACGEKVEKDAEADAVETNEDGDGTDIDVEGEEGFMVPEIEETVLYDKDGIKVTAKSGLEINVIEDYEFTLEVVNDTDKDYEVSIDDFKVEGAYLDYGCVGAVLAGAGSTASDLMVVDADKIKELGMNTLGQMTFRLWIKEPDNFDTDFYSEFVSLETSDSGKQSPQFETEGVSLIDESGVKMVGLGIVEGILGPEYKIYLKNDTDDNLYVRMPSLEETFINGEVHSFYVLSNLPSHSETYAAISLFDEELKPLVEAGISSMKGKILVEKGQYTDDFIIQTEELEFIQQ